MTNVTSLTGESRRFWKKGLIGSLWVGVVMCGARAEDLLYNEIRLVRRG